MYANYDTTKQRTVNQIIENLNEEQKQLLADVINYGGWGNADAYFGDTAYMCDGYITDEAYRGGHFSRRAIPNRLRSLYKALGMEGDKKSKQSDCMLWIYDWWEDGSGSILLIPEGLSDDFEDWAKLYKGIKITQESLDNFKKEAEAWRNEV